MWGFCLLTTYITGHFSVGASGDALVDSFFMHLFCSDIAVAGPDGQGFLRPSAYLTWCLVSGGGEMIDRYLVMMAHPNPFYDFKL